MIYFLSQFVFEFDFEVPAKQRTFLICAGDEHFESFDQIDQLTLLQLKGGDKGSRSRLKARIISLQLTETRTEWP